VKAIPADKALCLLFVAKIVVNRIIKTAKAQGFIASTAAADKTAGTVIVFFNCVFSGSSNGELSP